MRERQTDRGRKGPGKRDLQESAQSHLLSLSRAYLLKVSRISQSNTNTLAFCGTLFDSICQFGFFYA
jgi:hypothetical protein